MALIETKSATDRILTAFNNLVAGILETLNPTGTVKKIFGAWESKNVNEIYQASTDGIVHVYAWTNVINTWVKFYGVTDAATPPTVKRVGGTAVREGDTEVLHSGLTMAVRKNHYWKVFSETYGVGPIITVFFIPIGA